VSDFLMEEAFAGKPLSTFVVDAHCHLGEANFTVIDPSVESLIRGMDRCGIDVAVPNSTPGCTSGWLREGNDEVIAAARKFPERIFGMATINPFRPDESLEELKRCRDAGLRGLKIHDHIGLTYDDPRYSFAWGFCQEHGWPILAHTWGKKALDALRPHFDAYPGVRWVLGHAGAADREEYVSVAKAHSNVFLELCFSVAPRGLVEYFVGCGLEDRVLYGSDAVFMDAAPQIGRTVFAKISVDAKKKILGENARRVLKLEDE